ncbi:hypothetical protein SHI21_18875 [Bacteriovorax sp. PP10]|uniref:VOC domain-containing protein n=1 Tax=Bacteriovorax antarcticus TaxID=3088717 RepID=A0ABU5W0G9_9BACT|nr:hypothetical protein [Bacteriovorax sp. PP10]MEA9358307.1 hypothetical protein [Bacteriovorax sp. PP10]
MMDFLSDVFEFDVDPEQDLVFSGPLQLKLVELPASQKENFQSLGIKFAFKTKNTEELEEIVNKCNFFIYRKEDKSLSEVVCPQEQVESLSIKDIDGRIWQFDVETIQ